MRRVGNGDLLPFRYHDHLNVEPRGASPGEIHAGLLEQREAFRRSPHRVYSRQQPIHGIAALRVGLGNLYGALRAGYGDGCRRDRRPGRIGDHARQLNGRRRGRQSGKQKNRSDHCIPPMFISIFQEPSIMARWLPAGAAERIGSTPAIRVMAVTCPGSAPSVLDTMIASPGFSSSSFMAGMRSSICGMPPPRPPRTPPRGPPGPPAPPAAAPGATGGRCAPFPPAPPAPSAPPAPPDARMAISFATISGSLRK